jgi:hypothetical protein
VNLVDTTLSPEVQSSGDIPPKLSHPSQLSVTGKKLVAETEKPPVAVGSLDYDALAKTYFANKTLWDIDYQEFADFTSEQGGEEIDIKEDFREIYRAVYPNTDPELLDEDMKRRVYEELTAVINEGDEENMMNALVSFSTDPEFSVWAMGRFEGDMGALMNWLSDALQFPTSSVVSEMNSMAPSHEADQSLSELESPEIRNQGMDTDSENIEMRRERIKIRGVDVTGSALPSISTEQESSIRETLSRYGIDEGLHQLAETDPDAAEWLLRRFNSTEDLHEWHRSGIEVNRHSHSESESEPREALPENLLDKRGSLKRGMSDENDK